MQGQSLATLFSRVWCFARLITTNKEFVRGRQAPSVVLVGMWNVAKSLSS